jgi:hypothetical protein
MISSFSSKLHFFRIPPDFFTELDTVADLRFGGLGDELGERDGLPGRDELSKLPELGVGNRAARRLLGIDTAF